MKTEPIYVTKPVLPPLAEYTELLRGIWERRLLTNCGPLHTELEAALTAFFGVETVLFTNGHTALEFLLQTLPAGEIVTTPFTFASTANAILRSGHTPVFCEVKESDCTLDPAALEAAITGRTVAILPVHVYGNLCDDAALRQIADRHGIPLFYDAAHAFGVKTAGGSSSATLGDASMFSFHATKVFHTVEGGCICTKDAALAAKLRTMRNFGLAQGGEALPEAGGNGKMDEFRAAMGLLNLRHFEEAVAGRKAANDRYLSALSGRGLRFPADANTAAKRNYAYFPLLLPEKSNVAAVAARMQEQNIFTRRYFYPSLRQFAAFGGCPGETPKADALAARVLCLPLYPDLSEDDTDRVVTALLAALSAQ